jgi:hypothetical protein
VPGYWGGFVLFTVVVLSGFCFDWGGFVLFTVVVLSCFCFDCGGKVRFLSIGVLTGAVLSV